MKGLIRAGVLGVGLGLTCAWPAPARAESPAVVRDVVVVAAGAGVDGGGLRTAIGDELGVDAVAPGDARASTARGTIEVSVDEAAHALVVSYREKNGTPIVRRIDRPGDADATLRAAVLLAGNLARDEASELAEMLRRKGPAAEAPAASAADPELESDADFPRDPESERDLERMGQTLAWYTSHKRTLRETFAWTATGVGFAMIVGGLALSLSNEGNAGAALTGAGLGVGLVGPRAEPDGKLDELRTYYDRDRVSGRPPRMVRDDLESMWLHAARRERTLRLVAGVVDLVVVGATVATEVWLATTYAASRIRRLPPRVQRGHRERSPRRFHHHSVGPRARRSCSWLLRTRDRTNGSQARLSRRTADALADPRCRRPRPTRDVLTCPRLR